MCQGRNGTDVDRAKIQAVLNGLGALHAQAEEAKAPMLAYLIEVAVVEAMDILEDGSSPSAIEP
jgi:hypothetical protein